ncbi:sensor domain-containing diguanylate cyclase [Clostridium boliviensis]|uniref:Sensor domain-containing diguanylate cyclase n=1 Tax=Clostridium boliviensis TaxID=318465 RepID=A0ABU4GLM8_9CLOT|nr:sensor domain-containing diguanylate cyclase [Clostridium boliviensis]MDW2797157.1 sensor domain-containing diguanylate cyclase [Clostridium boliviensis]
MINRRNGGSYPTNLLILVSLVMTVIIGICVLNFYYFHEVERSLFLQTHRDLKQENDKALNYIETMMQTKFEWLELFANYCDLPDGTGKEQWWEQVQEYEKEDSRFGVADASGTLYFGNYETQDISTRDYLKKALDGEKNVSGLLKGSFNGRDSIVLSVPIIRDGTVRGAACLEVSADKLKEYLSDTQLSRYGANMIFQKDGEILITCDACENQISLFGMLETRKFGPGQTLADMENGINSRQSGYITYYENDYRRLLYYQPMGINDWFMATFVETEGYENTFHQIKELSAKFIAGSTFLLLCGGLLVLGILRIRKKEEKRLQKDYLTGVYTRETAKKLVEHGLKAGGKNRFYACMFLDIDDFKKINDTFGHHKGDLVLVQAGQILNSCTRQEDVIVRFGGDEFCIWLYGMRGRKQPEAIAQRIINAFRLSGKVHASIGITLIEEEETEYDAILKRADQALYQAKGKGKNQFAVYN